MKTMPKLLHKGSLITFLPKGCDKEQCLGYLMHFKGHGVYEPTFGKVDVTPQEADAHNAALLRRDRGAGPELRDRHGWHVLPGCIRRQVSHPHVHRRRRH